VEIERLKMALKKLRKFTKTLIFHLFGTIKIYNRQHRRARKMGQTTASDIAKYILRFSHDTGDLITNLKLQKLLYYAQGYYLALNSGEPLFIDGIQAWVHGPAVPSVYGEYKHNGWNPIIDDVAAPEFDVNIKKYLGKIINTFLPIDAYKLEQMTHKEPPWVEARGSLPPDASCKNLIKLGTMQAYFRSLLDSAV
jgi:uncharacterized phage-associated protein